MFFFPALLQKSILMVGIVIISRFMYKFIILYIFIIIITLYRCNICISNKMNKLQSIYVKAFLILQIIYYVNVICYFFDFASKCFYRQNIEKWNVVQFSQKSRKFRIFKFNDDWNYEMHKHKIIVCHPKQNEVFNWTQQL